MRKVRFAQVQVAFIISIPLTSAVVQIRVTLVKESTCGWRRTLLRDKEPITGEPR